MANAFFNMSRSSVTSANDLFSFRISSSSGFMRPLPGNASSVSPKYSRFHRCITLVWISRSRATSETFRPPSVTNQAASFLNSLSNVLLSFLFSTEHLQVLLSLSLTFRCVHHFGQTSSVNRDHLNEIRIGKRLQRGSFMPMLSTRAAYCQLFGLFLSIGIG